jgi:hypothetical protein
MAIRTGFWIIGLIRFGKGAAVENHSGKSASHWREKLIKTTKPGRDGTVRVTFALPADEPAGAVSVVGSFNNWDPSAHPLRLRANRTRSAAVTVQAGTTLHFRYLAEGGVWFDDETVAAQEGQDVMLTV